MTPPSPSRLLDTVQDPLCPENKPDSGRLGALARNQMVAKVGGPSARRLARAALLVPRIRHYEQLFGKLSPDELKSRANQLRGRARAGDMSREFIAEGFGLCSRGRPAGAPHAGRSTCSSPPAWSCTSRAPCPSWPPAKARRSRATFPVFLNALPGKGVHVTTVNDYLAKRDAELDRPGLQDARPVGRRASSRRWRTATGRRRTAGDVTYGTASRVRLRLPPRPAEASRRAGGEPPRSGPPWTARPGRPPADPRVQRGHSLRHRGRGRQHLHRRGQDAADHRQPDPRGRAGGAGRVLRGPTPSPKLMRWTSTSRST